MTLFVHFFSFLFGHVKKSSTFAPAFEKKGVS